MLPDYSIIGKRIRDARTQAKLTQEQLSDKLDVSIAFLSRIERGRSQINLKRLTQIAGILQVTPAYLISGSNVEARDYLRKDFSEILEQCTPLQQKFIYQVAQLVLEMNPVETH